MGFFRKKTTIDADALYQLACALDNGNEISSYGQVREVSADTIAILADEYQRGDRRAVLRFLRSVEVPHTVATARQAARHHLGRTIVKQLAASLLYAVLLGAGGCGQSSTVSPEEVKTTHTVEQQTGGDYIHIKFHPRMLKDE
jgi:hypothetical protein